MEFHGISKNIISDIDLELQRLKAGHGTTKASNSVTKAKTERRNECKDRFLNGFLSANEYLIAISLTIGREDYNLGTILPHIVESFEGLLDDTDEDEDNSEHCHVCLFPRTVVFAKVVRSAY